MLLPILLLSSFGVQIAYWVIVFRRLAFDHIPVGSGIQPGEGVSVIICARNESANLIRNLPLILQQQFDPYEVIVVDDHSSDNSVKILLDFQKNSTILRVVPIQVSTRPGKKEALALGISMAKYKWLLLTDADAVPSGNQWIAGMCAAVAKNTSIVLGYGPYMAEKGFLNLFIRFEAFWTALQYLSFARIGLPYMGVGRNLMYEKPLFTASAGFTSHANLASGDDDLFIRDVATASNTSISIDPGSFVYSRAKQNFLDYFRQKQRHLSTATRYRFLHQVLLGGISMSHFSFIILVLWSLCTAYWQWGLWLYAIRLFVAWPIIYKASRRLKDSDMAIWFPLLDFTMLFFYLVFSPSLFLHSGKKW